MASVTDFESPNWYRNVRGLGRLEAHDRTKYLRQCAHVAGLMIAAGEVTRDIAVYLLLEACHRNRLAGTIRTSNARVIRYGIETCMKIINKHIEKGIRDHGEK